ncbi:hypothetical protein [Acidianus manzaensis]|uniref:hypothetical protein n=1 Tax=Acidianus manzaensis TaxID=282676 RepID=UPI0016508359|nr:hypothetical protein [Acidianus manzaensis]
MLPIIQNENYIWVKLDWIFGEGADAYCVEKTKNGLSNPILIEIKDSKSKLF